MGGCCSTSKEGEKEMSQRMSQSRRCCNFVGLILVITILCVEVYIGFTAFHYGNYQRTVKGYDSYGNTCDKENDRIETVHLSGRNAKNDRILFFLNPYLPMTSVRLCVNTCPNQRLETANNVYKFTIEEDSRLCVYNVPVESYHDDTHSSWFNRTGKGPCPTLPVDKSKVLMNHCVPTHVPRILITYLNSRMGGLQVILSDFYNSWPKLMFIGVAAFVLSFVLRLSIQFCCPSIKVATFILVFPLIGLVGTGFLFWMYSQLKTFMDKETSRGRTTLDVYYYNTVVCLVTAVFTLLGMVLVISYMFFKRKRFSLVSPLFHETTKLIRSKRFVLGAGLSVLFTTLLSSWIVYSMFVLLYLHSVEDAVVDKKFQVTYVQSRTVCVLWWIQLVLLFVISNFIIATQKFIAADLASNIYINRSQRSTCRAFLSFLCNMGSVILGSILLSIVTFPKIVLNFVDILLKRSECDKLHPCLSCEGFCLYRHTMSVNDNAYTVMAVKGKGFCSSSKQAYCTLVHNTGRVRAMAYCTLVHNTGRVRAMVSMADFILLLVKMTAVATAGTSAVICFMYYNKNLYLYSVLVICLCVATYYICNSFLASYQMSLHAIIWCFCHDEETNDGSADKPYLNEQAHKILLNLVTESSAKMSRARGESASSEEREAVASV